jgi:hypothetical protein
MALGPRLKVWILLRICSIVNVCMCAKHLSRAEVLVDKMTLNTQPKYRIAKPILDFVVRPLLQLYQITCIVSSFGEFTINSPSMIPSTYASPINW